MVRYKYKQTSEFRAKTPRCCYRLRQLIIIHHQTQTARCATRNMATVSPSYSPAAKAERIGNQSI